MHIFDLCPLLQYIIIDLDYSFNLIISLSKTCRYLRDYIKANFKIYALICARSLLFSDFNLDTYIYHTFDINKLNPFEQNMLLKIYNQYQLSNYKTFAINKAAENGYIHTLEWIFRYHFHLFKDDPYVGYNIESIDNASQNGHINVLNWFFNKRDQIEFRYSGNAVSQAAASGHIHILEWFFEHSQCLKNYTPACLIKQCNHVTDTPHNLILEFMYAPISALRLAARNNRVNAIEWLINNIHFNPLFAHWISQSLYTSETIFEEAINDAVRYNHLSVIKIIYKYKEKLGLSFNYKLCINIAASSGYIDIIEWFYNRSSKERLIKANLDITINPIIPFNYNELALEWAASNGTIDSIQWFFDHREELPFICSNHVINLAAGRAYIHILDWFYEHSDYVPFEYDSYAIDTAADKGLLQVLDWFFDHSNEVWVQTHYLKSKRVLQFKHSENAMFWASINDYIHILQWFVNHIPKDNLRYDKEQSIAGATKYNNIDIVNWWYNSDL